MFTRSTRRAPHSLPFGACRAVSLARLVAISAALVAGCGGGGGGDGGDEEPTPTPESSVPLTITEGNYFAAMQVPTFYAEALLTLGHDVMRWTETLATAPTASATLSCGGGSLAARWSDVNNDGEVGPGDAMSLELSNCDAPASATRFSGTVQLSFGSPTAAGALAARVDFMDGLRFGADGVTAAWRGAFHAERILTARTDEVWVHAAASDRLRVELRSGGVAFSDRVEALDVVRAASRDWNGATTWLDMTLASDVLRGKVALETVYPIGASFDTYPVRGVLEVSGVGRVQLRGASGARTGWIEVTEGPAAGQGTNPHWTQFMQGFAWVGPGTLPQQYAAVQELQAVPFAYIGASAVAIDADVRSADWQFNRELLNAPAISAAQLVRSGEGWGASTIAGTVEVIGARLRLRWNEQLEPGARYDVQWLDGAGQPTVPQGLARYGNFGRVLAAAPAPAQLVVSDETAAQIVQPASTLLLPGIAVRLNGSDSRATGSSVVRYRWSQLDGIPVQLSSADQISVDVTLQATEDAAPSDVTLQLEVEDARGIVDRQTLTLRAVPSPSTAMLGMLRGSAGSPLLAGETLYVANAYYAGSWMNDSGSSPYARVEIGFPDPAAGGMFFYMPAGTPLQPGVYDAPLPPPSRGDGPGIALVGSDLFCWGTGSFTIHEVELSSGPANGNGTPLVRFSADFAISCDGAPAINGAVRIASARPLPN